MCLRTLRTQKTQLMRQAWKVHFLDKCAGVKTAQGWEAKGITGAG